MYITQGLHRQLQRQPQATAIRYQGRALSYAELGERVARLAGALLQLGVASGDRVAMLSLNSQRYLEYYLAVPWADAVLNPVNTRWSVAEIAYSLEDSQTQVLIVDDSFCELARQVLAVASNVRVVIYAGDGETPAGMLGYEALLAQARAVEDARRGGDELLGVFYTGGTTGFPKGVMLSHANVVSSSMALLSSGIFSSELRFLHVMPMFHLADYAWMCAMFISGGVHVVLPSFVPEQVLHTLATEKVSDMLMAPTMLQMLLDCRDGNEQLAALDVSSVASVFYGASPITPVLLQRALQAFPGAGFTQGYGMTELSPVACLLAPAHHRGRHLLNGQAFSAGQPAHCVEVRIVDGDDQPLPRGSIGEIVVKGPNVMLGYWNKPEATAEALRGGWMHTGDGGYMDEDGFVYVCDRIKDMIVSGGENVYSAEVESAISSHPAVGQCAVIGIPSEQWGESVHAVIILKPGSSASEQDIVAHCRERIAGYKCPRSFEFREVLPVSSVGKVLKTELRKSFWADRARGVA